MWPSRSLRATTWPRATEERLADVEILHRSPDLRLGDRAGDHARRRPVDPQTTDQPVPQHRRARGGHPGQLSGRLGADGAGHRGAGHRAAAQWHRRPALHLLGEQLRRQHDHHRHLRAGHQPRHRPGAGAEQAPAGHPAAAAGSAAAGHPRDQGGEELPAGHRRRLRRRQHGQERPGQLHRLQHPGPDLADQGCGRLPGVRRPVRHAHLAGPGAAEQLPADPGGREDRHPGAERADLLRPARRPARLPRHPAQRHHHRQDPPADPGTVRRHPVEGQPRRLPGTPARRGEDRTGRRELQHQRPVQRQAGLRHGDQAGHRCQRPGYRQGNPRHHRRTGTLHARRHESGLPL
ncbi:hypothetical protein FQZ97_437330 [compost metagenome]